MRRPLFRRAVVITAGLPAPPPSLANVGYPWQRKELIAVGLIWQFFGDFYAGQISYKTSANGVNWSSKIDLVSIAVGNLGPRFSVHYDGSFLHIVYVTAGIGDPILYRRGTPNGDGTITWSAGWQTVRVEAAFAFVYPTVAVDSGGYPWIGYLRVDGTALGYPFLITSSANDGTWVTAAGWPVQLNSAQKWTWSVTILPLNSLRMYVLYNAQTGPTPLYGRLYDGSLPLGAPENVSPYALLDWRAYTATRLANDVLVGWRIAAALEYRRRIYGTGWDAKETIAAVTGANVTPPILCVNPNSGRLVAFWAAYTVTKHVWYRIREPGGWNLEVDWIDESAAVNIASGDNISASLEALGGYALLTYMRTKPAATYQLVFNPLTL